MVLSAIERARRYISKCGPAISGQGGHGVTFHVAAVLVHGFALSDQDALMLLKEWNLTCQPPWKERELRHKIASAAAAQHAEPRGYLLGKAEGGRRKRSAGCSRRGDGAISEGVSLWGGGFAGRQPGCLGGRGAI